MTTDVNGKATYVFTVPLDTPTGQTTVTATSADEALQAESTVVVR